MKIFRYKRKSLVLAIMVYIEIAEEVKNYEVVERGNQRYDALGLLTNNRTLIMVVTGREPSSGCPGFNREVVGDKDVIIEVEEQLVLDALTTGVLAVMLMVEVVMALMLLLLVARDEVLNIF
ncbi:hypothetical protein RYX36_006510 [Vicia faba]